METTTARRSLFLIPFLVAAVAPLAGAETSAADVPSAESPSAEAPSTAAGLEIVVNVPAGELAVYEGDDFVRIFPVTVGTWRHPTPIGEFTLSKAVWNPWWHPPNSGWARGRKAQAPGPKNAMGRAKLYFKPLYFIHGTTETDKLGGPGSHGCVRMANDDVIALARLVHRHATPDLDPAILDRLAANPKATREIRLERPVTLRIVYERVELRGDELVVHPDVYSRVDRRALERQVAAALAERGETVDAEWVAQQLDGLHRDGGTIPFARLHADAGAPVAVTAAAER